MIAIGIACVVFCILYTTHLSYIGMGDVLVLAFFGVIPVCIPYYIQLHTCTWQVFLASLACGAVVDALLIVNNYRDRDNDKRDGKMTLLEVAAEVTKEDIRANTEADYEEAPEVKVMQGVEVPVTEEK